MIYKLINNAGGCTFKDADLKKGVVSGYFSRFNNVDNDNDIMKPGCYTKTIAENFSRIKHLQNHRVDSPLGKILSLKEDLVGLNYESQIGTHTLGLDFIKMVESGLITEHSVGFQILKKNRIGDYGDPNGTWEITEVRMWEGSSLTGWGVNSLTPLTSLKGTGLETYAERVKRMEKFCKTSTASDETIEMLLIEIKQLSQIIMDTEAENKKALQPSNYLKNWDAAINTFLNK